MLKLREPAFIKAMSNTELSSVFLRELKKAMEAAKNKKGLAAYKTGSTTASASRARLRPPAKFRSPSGKLKSSPARTSRVSQSSNKHPAPGHLFDEGPGAHGTTGQQDAQCSRQLGPYDDGIAYAVVVAGHAGPHQPSGKHKPQNKAQGFLKRYLSGTAFRRMSERDMSGPLCGMPDGTTSSFHAVNTCTPAGHRPNKTPIFITGVNDTRVFLPRLRASYPSDLTAQLKAENLMVVLSTADGFRATDSALRSLDGR
jgi:hypothetical protein